jgi:hypothetical protein
MWGSRCPGRCRLLRRCTPPQCSGAPPGRTAPRWCRHICTAAPSSRQCGRSRNHRSARVEQPGNAPFASLRAHRVHVLCCPPLRALSALSQRPSTRLLSSPNAVCSREGRCTHRPVSASMVPSSVGSVPVNLLVYRNLYTHVAAALSPQRGDSAHVQARWVRAVHAQPVQRVHGAQLGGQCARESVAV